MAGRRVNPPEQIQLPSIKDVGLLSFLKNLRFTVFQLWERTGAGDDLVDQVVTDSTTFTNSSQFYDLQRRIGSGKPVTIDTTGFTVDTTEQTTDKTEV